MKTTFWLFWHNLSEFKMFNFFKVSIMNINLLEMKLQKFKNDPKSTVFTKVQPREYDFLAFLTPFVCVKNVQLHAGKNSIWRHAEEVFLVSTHHTRSRDEIFIVTLGRCCCHQTKRCACALVEGKRVPYSVKRASIECVWLGCMGRDFYSANQNFHLRVKTLHSIAQIDVFPA